MVSISDFIKVPKIDSCKHLSSGMRYDSFVRWAGFIIPNFQEKLLEDVGGSEDLEFRKEIFSYINLRAGTPHDVFLLFCHSISESVTENVKVLNGTVNVDLLSNLNNPSDFIDAIKNSCEKYADKITVRPYLGLNSDIEKNINLATMLLESGIFAGIELYGTAFAEKPEKFLTIFKTARKLNIESRIGSLGLRNFADRASIWEIVQNLQPNVILNPNIVVKKDNLLIFKDGKILPEVINFLKSNNIRTEFSPAPFLSKQNSDEKIRVIREFAEQGLDFKLCSEDMLFLNKSLSEFAADLCNAGIFSKEEIVKIIRN